MKALWSAASGMKNLQLKIDTTANNLSNVQTVGFKAQRVEFKDIMYERLVQPNKIDEEGRPVPIEVGHGVMAGATLRSFAGGNLQHTENETDLAITGPHFFKVIDPKGNVSYTKDGTFKLSTEDDGMFLVTSEGFYVQGEGGRINLGNNVEELVVDTEGKITVKRANEEAIETIDRLSLNKFINSAGLEARGRNLYAETTASGMPVEGIEEGDQTEVVQGFIENSNVQIVDEMINLITSERAYEINAKAIQTADRLLEIANTLKR